MINLWALKNYKHLTKHTVLSIYDELKAHIAGSNKPHVLSSLNDAYALASRFKNVLYKYPYFKKKHLRILRAIIDRCGEAYYKQDVFKLYISKEVIEEWAYSFRIPLSNIHEYLNPLTEFHILEPSDRQGYIYKVNDDFFYLMGPAARHLVVPADTKKFAEMMAVVSGISSIYVMATAVKSGKNYTSGEPLIPWFVKLSMIYTLTGLEPYTMKIRSVLEVQRIDYVDNYFVIEKNFPVEWWRSTRTEAFEFMTDNVIIEEATPNGYKLNTLWVRMHEAGVKRYIERLRERYKRKYRSY